MSNEQRSGNGRFITGNTVSNGRPKGSRAKLSEAFLSALCDDFAVHGRNTIERVRVEKPDAYLKVIAAILPRQIEVKADAFEGVSDDELEVIIMAATLAIRAQQDDAETVEQVH